MTTGDYAARLERKGRHLDEMLQAERTGQITCHPIRHQEA